MLRAEWGKSLPIMSGKEKLVGKEIPITAPNKHTGVCFGNQTMVAKHF